MNEAASAFEFGGNLAAQEMGIASGDINIEILHV
jgi:hypothetical protein